MIEISQQAPLISPALQSELDALRDQRDLYHSLLRTEPESLSQFLALALESVESLRAALRRPTRESAAFRGKIEQLQLELIALEQGLATVSLPTISERLQAAAAAVNELGLRADISGNDLLPAMVLLEELCSHLLIAANAAAVHLPVGDEAPAEEAALADRGAHHKLELALQQMCGKLAGEHSKRITLVTVGLEHLPEDWSGVLFDLLAQLLRNAVEHGIEPAEQRIAAGKPEIGTLAIEFLDRGAQGFELNVRDDGAGLDTERLPEVAVKLGLLTQEAARSLEPNRLVNLIFQPGVTTAQPPGRRGLGMQIVRDHLQRMGGKMQIASKRGHYLRFQMNLPAR